MTDQWLASSAHVFRSVEGGIRLEDVLVARPRRGEVMIDVVACGACHSDLHKMEGHGTVVPPCIFGHEISGIVREVGEGIDDLAVGTPVVCAFLAPCGDCAACRDGRDDDCTTFRSHMQREGLSNAGHVRYLDAAGVPLRGSGIGGLVRQVVLSRQAVFPLPADWPSDIGLAEAAVLGCAAVTAFGAIRRGAEFQTGATALVLAAGGVGLCVVALLRHLGAGDVIVSDLKDDALEAALAAGASMAIRADDPEFITKVADRTDSRGVDVAFDTLGLSVTVNQAIAATRIGGRVVLSGLAGAGRPLKIADSNDLVRRRIQLVGSYAARPSVDMPDLLGLVADGALDPSALISARYSFENAAGAYASLADGQVTGRALIEYGQPGVDRVGDIALEGRLA